MVGAGEVIKTVMGDIWGFIGWSGVFALLFIVSASFLGIFIWMSRGLRPAFMPGVRMLLVRAYENGELRIEGADYHAGMAEVDGRPYAIRPHSVFKLNNKPAILVYWPVPHSIHPDQMNVASFLKEKGIDDLGQLEEYIMAETRIVPDVEAIKQDYMGFQRVLEDNGSKQRVTVNHIIEAAGGLGRQIIIEGIGNGGIPLAGPLEGVVLKSSHYRIENPRPFEVPMNKSIDPRDFRDYMTEDWTPSNVKNYTEDELLKQRRFMSDWTGQAYKVLTLMIIVIGFLAGLYIIYDLFMGGGGSSVATTVAQTAGNNM